MSQRKKQVRADFCNGVLERDGHRCVMCGKGGCHLDPHHITDRNDMPNGGYVAQNGIPLCEGCHELAERFHALGEAHPGYAPDDLYAAIGSSYADAHAASLN